MKCQKCNQTIPKDELVAYFEGMAVCQRCYGKRRVPKDIPNYWRRWIKIAERQERTL